MFLNFFSVYYADIAGLEHAVLKKDMELLQNFSGRLRINQQKL